MILTKNAELQILANDPFASDKLDRRSAIELLTKLLQSTEQSFVMSVEAGWGWGKTTFIDLWKAHLEKQGHVCLRFNAWEHDFVEDPMVAFLGEMSGAVRTLNTQDDPAAFPLVNELNKVKEIGGTVIKAGLPIAIQILTHGLVSSRAVQEATSNLTLNPEALAEAASEFSKKRVEQYQSDREGLKAFRAALGDLAQKIATLEGKKKPLVFFVDELDRCRPDFAVQLLERIKHLFNVSGMFFVLAMDREQLGSSIQSLYGQQTRVDGYLRRFIDLRFKLPPPPPDRFCTTLMERYGVVDVLQKWPNPNDCTSELHKWFSKLAAHFGLSLRIQEQCFTEINIGIRGSQRPNEIQLYLIVFLVCFRAHQPEPYERLVQGGIDGADLAKYAPPDDTPWFSCFLKAVGIVAQVHAKNGEIPKISRETENGEHLSRLISAIRPEWQGVIRNVELAPTFQR